MSAASISADASAPGKIPLVFSTDLYHPAQDPDDHYDLATIARLDELDLKCVIFDQASFFRKPQEVALGALEQVSAITGKPMPWALGLNEYLQSADDKGLGQDAQFQNGVEQILKTLRESSEKAVLFTAASCRDFAAAFNREPVLFKEKVSAIYLNVGKGPDGIQAEWNVKLDPLAFVRLLESDLPVYWCPCLAPTPPPDLPATPQEVKDGVAFNTFYIIPDQDELLRDFPQKWRNYFAYALSYSTEDPMQYLGHSSVEIPKTRRKMWCTGPFYHAARRRIYKVQNGYAAYSPEQARALGLADRETGVFRFEHTALRQGTPEKMQFSQNYPREVTVPFLVKVAAAENSTLRVFRYTNPDYNDIMVSVYKNLFMP